MGSLIQDAFMGSLIQDTFMGSNPGCFYELSNPVGATSTVLTDKLKIYGNNGKGIEVKIFYENFVKFEKLEKTKF